VQIATQSSTQTQGGNSPVRRHPRLLLSVPIVLRHLTKTGIDTTRGITLDVSEGGLGALVQGSLSMGETVEIDLRLREHPLKTVAIVRQTCSTRSGFEFLGLTEQERQLLATASAEC